jgi:hypothetical protein
VRAWKVEIGHWDCPVFMLKAWATHHDTDFLTAKYAKGCAKRQSVAHEIHEMTRKKGSENVFLTTDGHSALINRATGLDWNSWIRYFLSAKNVKYRGIKSIGIQLVQATEGGRKEAQTAQKSECLARMALRKGGGIVVLG